MSSIERPLCAARLSVSESVSLPMRTGFRGSNREFLSGFWPLSCSWKTEAEIPLHLVLRYLTVLLGLSGLFWRLEAKITKKHGIQGSRVADWHKSMIVPCSDALKLSVSLVRTCYTLYCLYVFFYSGFFTSFTTYSHFCSPSSPSWIQILVGLSLSTFNAVILNFCHPV